MSEAHFTKRNLPHWFVPGADHFVTFRLAGTLPPEAIDELKYQKQRLLENKPEDRDLATHRGLVNKRLFAMYDNYLDRDSGRAWLAEPKVAARVRKSLRHFDGERYNLLAYCIMPNHVHILIRPLDGGLRRISGGRNIRFFEPALQNHAQHQELYRP